MNWQACALALARRPVVKTALQIDWRRPIRLCEFEALLPRCVASGANIHFDAIRRGRMPRGGRKLAS